MPTLAELRTRLPLLDGLDDESAIQAIQAAYYPTVPVEALAQRLGYTPPAPPVEEPSTLRSAADSALALGQGVVTGVKGLSDLAGADNPVSQALGSANETMSRMLSAFRQNELQQRAQKIKEAEESGSTLNEVGAYLGGFAEAPLDTTLQAAGTMLPNIAAMMIPGVRESRLAALAAGGAVGAAQGAGFVKGGIYEAVKNRAIEEGRSPEEAEALAVEAQRYGGENSGQMALGAGLGAGAALGPVERIASGMASRTATQGMLKASDKLLPRVALGAGAEAIPEALQGGQQKLAENLAQGRSGFETDPMRGVLGSAAVEAAAAAGLGGAVSLPKPSAPKQKTLAEGLQDIAEAPDVDSAIKAAGDALDMTPEREAAALAGIERQGSEDAKGLKQFGVGKSPPPAGVRQPAAPGEASATTVDAPFADRVLTLREQLADPQTRESIRARWGDTGLNNATYYASVADMVGNESLPERTRDNLLAVAEQMVRAAVLKPIQQPAQVAAQPGGMLQLGRPDAGPPRIGLDTAPTGTIRVDAEGNAAPETRADAISARQRQAEADSLGKGTPRGAAPPEPAIRLPGPIPTGEATEVESIPTGEATELQDIPVGDAAEAIPTGEATEAIPTGEATELQDIPVGDATEAIPTGEATELPKRIPVGKATEIEPEVIDGDLLTQDGMPYGSKAGANLRARKEGLGPENVVEIPGAGWVVRPVIEARPAGTRGTNAADVLPKTETAGERVGDMAGTAGRPAGGSDGRTPDAGGSGVAVRRVAADAGRGVQDAAGSPVAGGGQAQPAGDGGGRDAALSEQDAFEHAGLKVYPGKVRNRETGAIEPRWAVQLPENKGTNKALGDTLHATREEAMKAAEQEAARFEREQRRRAELESQDAQLKAAEAERKAKNQGKSLAEIRRDAVLDKETSDGGQRMTRRQWVERKVAEGLKPRVEQEDRIKPMTRAQFNRASNAEQRAHDQRVKEAGKKDVFWIGDYEVSKTEHDYAVGLRAAPPPAKEGPTPQGAPDGERLQGQGRRQEALTPAPAPQEVPAAAGRFVIAERRATDRAAVGSGEQSRFTYVPDERLGRYETIKQAKAALMRKLDPSLKNADDDFAARHFDRQQRNEGTFKVIDSQAPTPTATKLQARQDRQARAERDEPTIELRKRLSVLRSIRGCLDA